MVLTPIKKLEHKGEKQSAKTLIIYHKLEVEYPYKKIFGLFDSTLL